MPETNRQITLAARPAGLPKESDFKLVNSPIPAPRTGEFLVRLLYVSVDPYMRGRMNDVKSYAPPVAIGEVMGAGGVGVVTVSQHPQFKPDDIVNGFFGWQEYAVTDGRPIRRKVREVDLPRSLSLGILGINGVTAYFALTAVGEPRPGDTVVVSTAAGAVGSAVGQIAKIAGCSTVGIAGGARKQQLCRDEFDYDFAVDYKAAGFEEALSAATPAGVDVYDDNTAGAISDAVIQRINRGARIVVCGTASVSNWDDWPSGPRVERHLLNKAARMQGFLIWDYEHRYKEAVARLAGWVRDGRLRYREEILDGIERAPGSIARLYRGENDGKLLVRLHDSR